MHGWRGWLQDSSGAVADLGLFAPIAAALILRNGLDAGTVLVGMGALYVVSGWYFRVPVPVQPIKAAAAIAIVRGLGAETIGAAGLMLGLVLIVLAATGATGALARLFSIPLVRGLQLGVGLILVRTAIDMVAGAGSTGSLIAGVVVVGLVVAGRAKRTLPVALVLVAGAAIWAGISAGGLPPVELGLWTPALNTGALDLSVLASAAVLLAIPQLPLTLGNAVVAVVELEHRYFPINARKVTPPAIGYSCGIANVAVGALGGMPMCHGSGGLTAHYRAGARSHRMNLVIGGALLIMGLLFGPTALGVVGLVPIPVLAGLLAFTGYFHSGLVAELRGIDLAIAVTMGVLGLVTTNLAIALGIGLIVQRGLIVLTGRRPAEALFS